MKEHKCIECEQDLINPRAKRCHSCANKIHGFKKGNPAPKTAFKKGMPAWNKGMQGFGKGHPATYRGTSERKGKTLEEMYGIEKSREIKLQSSISHKGYKPSKELIKKRLQRNPVSSLEKKFMDIVNRLNLPYRFVGNGDFFIERKCPDFINCNGEKIAVEVYYRKHKEQFRKGLESWKIERREIFGRYGWAVQFFDETQVNDREVMSRLEC